MKKIVIHSGRILDLVREEQRLPNGRVAWFEIVRHPGGAAVLPILADGRVVLIRQFRPAIGRSILEVPAGRLEPGEDPATCARRELQEETGHQAGRLVPLGSTLASAGFCDERIHLFAAFDLTETASSPEPDECIEVVTFPLDEALAMVAVGRIDDAKTQLALLLYAQSPGGQR